MALKSPQELYDIYIQELQALKPDLTDVAEGSINDVLAGTTMTAVSEIIQSVIEEFKKTFIDTADGPEITGGPDDLQTLAVDHFGDEFARPGAAQATGVVAFSRPTSGAGNVSILAGTIVKTATSAAGNAVRFEVVTGVTLTGLTVNASVRAVVAGTSGNVQANKVTVIETALTDPTVVVNNAAGFAGGSNVMSDSEYREFIRNLITKIRGATKEAIEAAAKTVAGVVQATAIELQVPVIKYDIATDDILSGEEFFRIPFPTLYIADANGTASPTLIQSVKDAIEEVRAFGVYIKVAAASALAINWTAAITLNVSGPNYAEFSSDTTKLTDAMQAYITELAIGSDFIVADAEAAIMALYGPSGTNDLTAFNTSVPSGDVATAANEKLIPGTMTIS